MSEVVSNGLPETDYNKALADFDNHMCNLIDRNENGIPILIETFSGMRNYYYYVRPEVELESLLEAARLGFDVELTAWEKIDPEWGFLGTYPIEVFCKETAQHTTMGLPKAFTLELKSYLRSTAFGKPCNVSGHAGATVQL